MDAIFERVNMTLVGHELCAAIGGVERKIHFFAFDLPHSDACFVVAYPQERS